MGIIEFIFGPGKKKAKKKELPEVARGVLEEQKPMHAAPESLPELGIREIPSQAQNTIMVPHIEPATVQMESHPGTYGASAEAESSFFNDLLRHLRTEDSLLLQKNMTIDQWRERNLVGEMKQYWQEQKESIQQFRKSQILEEDLQHNIDELQRLEADWQRLEHESEEIKKSMEDKERQIEVEGERLKTMLRKWNLKKDVGSQSFFHLHNGIYCKNAADLARALVGMDEATFRHHVDESHNDFANWVRDVFNDKDLAEALKSAQSRESAIRILEQALA